MRQLLAHSRESPCCRDSRPQRRPPSTLDRAWGAGIVVAVVAAAVVAAAAKPKQQLPVVVVRNTAPRLGRPCHRIPGRHHPHTPKLDNDVPRHTSYRDLLLAIIPSGPLLRRAFVDDAGILPAIAVQFQGPHQIDLRKT